MRKSLEEILGKIEQERKERKLFEEENFKKKLEIVEKQKAFMLESRRMFESSGFSSAAGAGAGAGGSTPARMNYRKYFNLDYSSGLTLNYFNESYVKFFLPYVGDLRFSTDLSLLSGGFDFASEIIVEFNQINGFWEKRSNGTLIFESNRDLYVTSDSLIDGDDGISILTPGNTSNSLLLSTSDGNLPRGLTQMTLFGIFDEITDENSPFYIGSYFETTGDEEVVLVNEGAFGGDEETWYLFLRGPDEENNSPDDTLLTLTGSLTPFGTYSTLNQGSEFSGTYVVTSGYVI